MTIPSLLSDIDKRDKFTGLQKALSTVAEVSARIRMENGNSMAGLASTSLELANLFKEYMKPIQFCENAADSEKCYVKNTETIHSLQGGKYGGSNNIFASLPKIVTADGFVYIFYNRSDSIKTCGGSDYVRNGTQEFCTELFVDINGTNAPNTVGKDIWDLSINKYNVTPFWVMRSTANTPNTQCKSSGNDDWNGCSCGARAILDGKIDYY